MAEKLKALEGRDLADYTRSEVPQGRWSDTWGVFKSNFGKIVMNNLITLIFFVPFIAILYLRNAYVDSLVLVYPFGSNFGSASPMVFGDLSGMEEKLYMSWDVMFYALAIVAGLIASIGIAGSFYSMKKLVNTHGKFTLKSYFHGVRVSYLNTAIPVLLFSGVLFATVVVCDWKNYTIALGNSAAWPTAAMVLMIILTVLVGLLCLWFVAVGVSYKVNPWQQFKNGCVLTVGFIIQTVIMAGIAFIPVWFLFMGSVMKIIAYILFIVFGFSFVSLVWMSFTQWAFDMYITPALEKEKAEARSKMTEKELAAEKEEQEKQLARDILAAGRSEIIGRPVKPMGGEPLTGLTKVFTRSDVSAVAASRGQLQSELSTYEEEHKNDTVYVEYNKLFAEREKALQDNSKKGKKKKVSSENLLR